MSLINKNRLLFPLAFLFAFVIANLFFGCGGETKPAENDSDTLSGPVVNGFRGVQWGMTEDEVKGIEKLSITHEDSSVLIYTGKVYDRDAEIYYQFDETGSLFSGTVKFKVSESDIKGAVNIYNAVKNELVKEFGAPSVDVVMENDSAKIFDKNAEYSGILTGEQILSADWDELQGSQVGLILSKPKDSELSLGVVYKRN
ncbi:MAG: hypothetical protein F9K26_01005 [Ignavibacteriaceae bacterium]|nr:MAG: hypothetical protein F9K26_01005 [Ignavibacteriaceae bacterium]MBV6446114.1 hypothetical protein [Ignavibacteriaceae bacterium]MBW7871990.1 hypothetical protein [Ignavibacteria bacterium]WKZ72916.1 MAG: hypothetical protein QY308_01650 [Ignavibacteriaceae bacterium]